MPTVWAIRFYKGIGLPILIKRCIVMKKLKNLPEGSFP